MDPEKVKLHNLKKEAEEECKLKEGPLSPRS